MAWRCFLLNGSAADILLLCLGGGLCGTGLKAAQVYDDSNPGTSGPSGPGLLLGMFRSLSDLMKKGTKGAIRGRVFFCHVFCEALAKASLT